MKDRPSRHFRLLYAVIGIVLVGGPVVAHVALACLTQQQESELQRAVEVRRRTYAHTSWPRPVVGGVARPVDARREITAAVARIRLSAEDRQMILRVPKPPEMDVSRILQENAVALDALARAATAARLSPSDGAGPADLELQVALDLLSMRARRQDGAACLDTSLAGLRLTSDAFLIRRLVNDNVSTFSSCVPRASSDNVIRASSQARTLVAAWPNQTRRGLEAFRICASWARPMADGPSPLFEWPLAQLARFRLARSLADRCAPNADPERILGHFGLARDYDGTSEDDLRRLHALVLALEAAGGQTTPVGDPFASGITVSRRADGSVEARAANRSNPYDPIVVVCGPPGSELDTRPLQ